MLSKTVTILRISKNLFFGSTVKGLLQSLAFCDSMDLFCVCLFALRGKACLGHIKDVKCNKPRRARKAHGEYMDISASAVRVGKEGQTQLRNQIFRDEGGGSDWLELGGKQVEHGRDNSGGLQEPQNHGGWKKRSSPIPLPIPYTTQVPK